MNWKLIIRICAVLSLVLIPAKALGITPLPWWVVLLPLDLIGALLVLLLVGWLMLIGEAMREGGSDWGDE